MGLTTFPGVAENFVAYTPTWTATGGGAAIGNGILLGRYFRIGKSFCHVRISMTIGSTSTLGSGGWRWALPPFPAYLPASMNYMAVGFGHNYDTSLGKKYGRLVEIPNESTNCRLTSIDGAAEAENSFSAPFLFATGDEVHFFLTYELA